RRSHLPLAWPANPTRWFAGVADAHGNRQPQSTGHRRRRRLLAAAAILGAVPAAGRSVVDRRALIAARTLRATRRDGDICVSLAARAPLFRVGVLEVVSRLGDRRHVPALRSPS